MKIAKFVLYNEETGEYVKRGCGVTQDPAKARLYHKRCYAELSHKRKHLDGTWSVQPVALDLDHEVVVTWNTYRAVAEGTPIAFGKVVEYFASMYKIDLTGQRGDDFPMSVNMVEAIYRALPISRGFGNGDRVMLEEKNFFNEMPLIIMIGAEIVKMFGYETQGRRVALIEIDWFDENGRQRDYVD